MKTFVEIVCLLSAFSAAAFDSQAWLGVRARHAREAVRMRGVYSNCLSRVQSPAERVKIPIEQFDDGSVKTLLEAEKMQYFLDSGLIWAEGVKIRKFTRERKVVAGIDARTCVIDRVKKNGWAEGRVRAFQDRTVVNGDGVYFSSPEDYVRVMENVFIRSEDLNFGGMR